MAVPNLPVNVDATYDDSPTDASRKTHQQHHDLIHGAINDLFGPAHAVTVNVKDYGALGTWDGSTGADDTTAVLAAITALQAAAVGGAIFFPPLPTGRMYKLTSPLPNVSGIRYYGLNRETTRLRWTTGTMLAPTTSLHGLVFEGLSLESSSGHLIDLGTTGGMYFSKFHDCVMVLVGNSSSLVHQSGSGAFQENSWFNCDLYRPATSTVPAFDIVNTSGSANANVWKRIRANSANCTSSPFWRIEASVTGTYAYDNTFEDIVGEQNPGGLIHLYSVNSPRFSNVYDWDASTTYADHVIKVDKSATSTTESRNICAISSGRRGGTLGGGIKDFYINSAAQNVTLINVGNHTTTPVVSVPWASVVIGDLGAGYAGDQRFRVASAGIFDGFVTSAALMVSPTYTGGRGLDAREGVTGYTGEVLHARKFADTGDHFVMNGAGKMRWGPGDGTFDLTLERLSSGVIGVNGVTIKPQIDVFTSSGTWTKPTGATTVQVVVVSGGSGGGSGRRGAAASVRCGGGGAGSGGVSPRTLSASVCGATETVTVGTGGAGGAAVTANDTNGNAGAAGGLSSFGNHVKAWATTAGGGGTNAAGTGGGGAAAAFIGGNGGAASGSGGVGTAGTSGSSGGASGAGAGGGITSGDSPSAGGAGGNSASTGTTASAGAAIDTSATSAAGAPANSAEPGLGGGGGGGSIVGAAGAGANGSLYGGGGGGGGASLNGNNSGKGGDGATGIVLVITTF